MLILCNLSKTDHQLRNQTFKCMRQWDPSSFKPPHRQIPKARSWKVRRMLERGEQPRISILFHPIFKALSLCLFLCPRFGPQCLICLSWEILYHFKPCTLIPITQHYKTSFFFLLWCSLSPSPSLPLPLSLCLPATPISIPTDIVQECQTWPVKLDHELRGLTLPLPSCATLNRNFFTSLCLNVLPLDLKLMSLTSLGYWAIRSPAICPVGFWICRVPVTFSYFPISFI